MQTLGSSGSRLTVAKLVMGLAGIALFGTGIRLDEPGLRWAGVAIVGLAWLLRFVRRRDAAGQLPDETR